MNPADAVATITRIGVAAFVIERIVAALMFLAAYFNVALPTPKATEGVPVEKRTRIWSFALAAILAGFVLWRYQSKMQLLSSLNIAEGQTLDLVVTWIVLVSGTDRIAAFLKAPSAPAPQKQPSQPIQVTGTLTLDEGAAKRMAAGQSR